MASEDVTLLTAALARTHVGTRELSYRGRGLKLDSAGSVEELVQEIEAFQELRALRLEGNTVGVEAAQAIAKALETKSLLQCCYWSDMFTGRLRTEIPQALTCLGSALVMAGTRLTELDLSDNAFGPDGVMGIEMLLKSSACHSLRELRLNNCGMGIAGGKILAAALTECHAQSSHLGAPLRLKVFVAGRNRLENDGAVALALAFQTIGSLEEIHMPQNGINHPGVAALATAMQHNPQLRVANFNDNTFTKKGAIAMAQALKHLRNIQVINFGDCLVRSEGALAIAESLREGLPVLKELILSFGELSEAAAVEVVRALKDKQLLETLDLNGNCLGEEGCLALKQAVEDMNMGDVLGSLSDDEGELEEDEDDDDDDDDDGSEEEEEEEEEEEDDDQSTEDQGKEEKIRVLTPVLPSPASDFSTFLCCPSADGLLRLGAERAMLIEQQVDVSDAGRAAVAFLKVSSVFEEEPEIRRAVLESIDVLLKKAFSSPSFQTYNFISTLLVMLGLLKSESSGQAVRPALGHLVALEHAVRQDYFPAEQVATLDALLSRHSKAFESCTSAGHNPKATPDRRIGPEC